MTPEDCFGGFPKNQQNGLFYRCKASESGLVDLKLGWLTRSTFPVGQKGDLIKFSAARRFPKFGPSEPTKSKKILS